MTFDKTLACGAVLALASGSALADFSANVGLTSNYVFRGLTQTDNGPAIQGGFDYSHESGVYLGVWGSNVTGYGPDNSVELDLYGGWGTSLAGFDIDLGYLRYQYPKTDNSDNNTDEFHIGASRDFGMLSAGYTFYYSPDFFGAGKGYYHDFAVDVPLPADFSVGLHYGFTRVDDGDDYDDYSISVGKSFGGFDFSVGYTNTVDLEGGNDDNWMFTVGKSF